MNLDTVDGFIGGNVMVHSTSGRGFTPEELAEQALDKIVYVGSKSHPVIREQAEAFKNAVGTTLDTLMQNLQSAREGVDNGVRVLSGEAVDQPMAMPGDQPADMSGELPPAPGSDLDQEEGDTFGATDAAVGGTEELGREKR